jgi:hypothetical protein
MRVQVAIVACVMSGTAHADHHHMAMSTDEVSSSSVEADLSVLAASFSPSVSDNMDYGGNYQGILAGGSWAKDRYAAGVSWSYYRMRRNGAESFGVGDIMVHGQVDLVARHDVRGGVMLAVSMPTGDDIAGFGMGHLMLMPAAWATWRLDRVALTGAAGYSQALFTPTGHIHGMAPLVEPMNMAEISWTAACDVAIVDGTRAGVRLTGGVPVGSMPGVDRVIGVARVAWGRRSVETAAELQAGLVGDPFNIRGVVSTALRF